MATTTLGDSSVVTRTAPSMRWIIGIALLAAIIIAFMSMGGGDVERDNAPATPGTESTATPGGQ